MSYANATSDELILASRLLKNGQMQSELSVPGMKCAGCINKIEKGLSTLPGVVSARVNLSTKRVSVVWNKSDHTPPLIDALNGLGFAAHLSSVQGRTEDNELRRLIRALAVAGFGAGNIMMLSVGVWAGAGEEARALFHWLSAAIALPVLIFSGRIFFSSAWTALRARSTNMDVPISVGILLTFALSLYDTAAGCPHAYFDAATSLLFFLLIGRTLDHVMRARAHNAISALQNLAPRGATVVHADGSTEYRSIDNIKPGMLLRIAAGGRFPVDAVIVDGRTDIDVSVTNGESSLQIVKAGDSVVAGALSMTGSITARATASEKDSFLADMIRMMENAEGARHQYRRIADRISDLYTPVVHLGALIAFFSWLMLAGDLHRAVAVAVSVLIITCPCALGLAVPMVQVMAAKKLFRAGVMIKDGAALERLADVDTIVFDKTGTLTTGTPRLSHENDVGLHALNVAGAMASYSTHPYSRALAQASGLSTSIRLEANHVAEYPGDGLEAEILGVKYRLGRLDWAASLPTTKHADETSCVALSRNGELVAIYDFEDDARPSAGAVIKKLEQCDFNILMLSGDREYAVSSFASRVGVSSWEANLRPAEKVKRITEMTASGRKILMVGDGVNDAPALAAAYASMAPGSATDIGRNSANFVFLNDDLNSIPLTIETARRAKTLMRQNIAFAILYNAIAVPIAFLGLVTPLIAALAMSASSLVVVLNSFRFGGDTQSKTNVKKGRDLTKSLLAQTQMQTQ
ncbi:MAG: heavy metal translocating P-type ATPase [Parvularculaceae bacterium]